MSAIAYDGDGDPAFVEKRLNEIHADRSAVVADTLEGDELREHVESTPSPDTVFVEVRGDDIECEIAGVGRRIRPGADAIRAEERGDEYMMMTSLIDMIDVLVDVSDDDHPREFWDDLHRDELEQVFREYNVKCVGGERAGE